MFMTTNQIRQAFAETARQFAIQHARNLQQLADLILGDTEFRKTQKFALEERQRWLEQHGKSGALCDEFEPVREQIRLLEQRALAQRSRSNRP